MATLFVLSPRLHHRVLHNAWILSGRIWNLSSLAANTVPFTCALIFAKAVSRERNIVPKRSKPAIVRRP